MPIFLIFFILFVIWLNVKTKRGQNNNSEWDTDYWEKERQANFVRRKDISGLDYITISEDELPFSDTAEGEENIVRIRYAASSPPRSSTCPA